MHPASLPGDLSNGDIGHEAYRFIEFLHSNGFRVWQMLPLGPTHEDLSPYQCTSAHAGNPLLISLDWLVDRGWLKIDRVEGNKTEPVFRYDCLKQAGEAFYKQKDKQWQKKYSVFYSDHSYWLDEYALYVALKARFSGAPWYDWPEEFKLRQTAAIEQAREELRSSIQQTVFEQFVFFTQWHEVRDYARKYEVELFGDMPIFVAHDSADVWAEKDNFLMNASGEMPFVAGVPPDAFSESGQRWGNPLYDWEFMQQDGFSWWMKRFETQLKLFDIVRLDHFRGLQASWHIPSDEETAIKGEWVEVPGRQLLNALFRHFDGLPLVAEDLGVITDEVIQLKDEFELPGMKVLQFAYDGNNLNPHLPHCHHPGDVVYTGTHDNDTSMSWAETDSVYDREFMQLYAGKELRQVEEIVMQLMRHAMASVSFLCVIPMQDILLLGSDARMNVPGTMNGNWRWRFKWSQLRKDVLSALADYMSLYQR